jgi:Type II secretory pathway, component PulF
MPYFKWFGTDIAGRSCKGAIIARSTEQVQQFLHDRQIAYGNSYKVFAEPQVSIGIVSLFLQQLATLLAAGVRLHDALEIACEGIAHAYFTAVIADVAHLVQAGIALSEACKGYPSIFDQITVQLMLSGERAGTLAGALEQRAIQLTMMEQFLQKVRRTLLMPLITLFFFALIALLLLVVVVPQFQSILQGFNKPLPFLTQVLFAISSWIRSPAALYMLGCFVAIGLIICRMLRQARGKQLLGRIVLRMPLLNTVALQSSRALLMQTWALLLQGGVHSVEALELAGSALWYDPLRAEALGIAQKISQGIAPSHAFQGTRITAPEIIAFLRIGEASGELAGMVRQAGALYQERTYQQLEFLSKIVQPLVLILLGLLIAVLLFALYEPIFTLTQIL